MFRDVVKKALISCHQMNYRKRICINNNLLHLRETMKVLNMDLKYENSEKPMELDDDLEI